MQSFCLQKTGSQDLEEFLSLTWSTGYLNGLRIYLLVQTLSLSHDYVNAESITIFKKQSQSSVIVWFTCTQRSIERFFRKKVPDSQ